MRLEIRRGSLNLKALFELSLCPCYIVGACVLDRRRSLPLLILSLPSVLLLQGGAKAGRDRRASGLWHELPEHFRSSAPLEFRRGGEERQEQGVVAILSQYHRKISRNLYQVAVLFREFATFITLDRITLDRG